MHYTVANPCSFGIHTYQPVLPTFSPQKKRSDQAKIENYLASLNKINAKKLSSEDQYTLSLLTQYFQREKVFSKFTYYEEPLSPHSGMQSQLPILFAEYAFRTKKDVEDYLSLLRQIEPYFNSLILFENQKADAGLFMPDFSLKKVIKQCQTIIDQSSLDSNSHFLQTTFEERIFKLQSQNKITTKERISLIHQNNEILNTSVLPAYQTISTELQKLKGRGKNPQGLFYAPNGKFFYSCLLKKTTGTNRSVQECKDLLNYQLKLEYQSIRDLLKNNPTQLSHAFPTMDPKIILDDLKKRMRNDFPPFPSAGQNAIPEYQIKQVSPCLESFTAPAFYLTPPLDETTQNVIYLNQKNHPAGLTLYTTLAHEGYPGHLYQSVFHNLHMQKNNIHPVRSLLWYGGYLEGWALYTEFLSYDYASEIMKNKNDDSSAVNILLEKHSRSLQLCLLSLFDLMIHYEGASFQTICDILNSFGIHDPKTQKDIYQYILEEPCNYPKYYIGYLEVLSAKKKARDLWGADYTDYKFHQFLLECGPSDFQNLSSRISSFYQERKN